MQVLYTRATRLPPSSVTSHSSKPNDRVRFTSCPVARSRASHTGFRNFTVEIQRRERLVVLERRRHGHADGGIGQVAHDAAVQRPHRVRVLPAGFQLEHGATQVDRHELEPDELCNRRRLDLAAEERRGAAPSASWSSALRIRGVALMMTSSTVREAPSRGPLAFVAGSHMIAVIRKRQEPAGPDA